MLSNDNLSDLSDLTECLDNPSELIDTNNKMYIKDGLSARRPTALKLHPINTNLPATTTIHSHNNNNRLNGDNNVDGGILGKSSKTTPAAAATSTPSCTSAAYASTPAPAVPAPIESATVRSSVHNLDISFSHLSYTVKTGIWKKEIKTILNAIHGEFKSGELSALMGPSGAGKSTLMDILAGYTTTNVTGRVTINGRLRDLKRFRQQSAYIMQDHGLQPYITVLEAMHFSVHLKNGNEMTTLDKKVRIKHILEAIGLYESRKTRTGTLSGGQMKRLAIALELVDNPPVMFFDEPTSGLDSSTSTQVVSLLKKLAEEGRTIICTIHQPSASVFGMFDHLFAIADGQCIYTGGTQYVVRFLSELNLKCPESYNPSDYLLEISTNDYGEQNHRLVEKTENGKQINYRKLKQSTAQNFAMEKAEKMMAAGLMTPVKAPLLVPRPYNPNHHHPHPHHYPNHNQNHNHHNQLLSPIVESTATNIDSLSSKIPKKINNNGIFKFNTNKMNGKCCKIKNDTYATSFCRQFSLLLMRTFLILWRDKSLTSIRIGINFGVALLIGTLYFGIGNDASNVFNNFRYVFLSIMFTMFTAFSSMSLAFPLELPIVTREHFNRWYSLRAYYVAMTLADVPIQIGCILIFIVITYLMTSQPLEIYRFGLFFIICLLTAFVAQSLGLVVGALFSVKNGAIVGPFFICPFLIFSGFFIHVTDAHTHLQWIFHISFLKYALEGATISIFGYNRTKMNCDEMYCQFILPEKFMKTVGMDNGDYMTAILALIIIFFLFRFTAFYIMSFRLKNRR